MAESPCFDWNIKTAKSFAGSSPWRGCLFYFCRFSVHSASLWALQAFLEMLSADSCQLSLAHSGSAQSPALTIVREQSEADSAEKQRPKSLFLELCIILLKSDRFMPPAFLFQQCSFKPMESPLLGSPVLCVWVCKDDGKLCVVFSMQDNRTPGQLINVIKQKPLHCLL